MADRFPMESIRLGVYEDRYSRRGNHHFLEYYDGPLVSAQMCVASEDSNVIEIVLDQRAAETDGHYVYTRLTRSDLERMLRILDEDPVTVPEPCGDSPGSRLDGCEACTGPGPHDDRDE